MSDTDRSAADPFGAIADEFVEAVRQGMRPSVEEFARRYPQHADEIREMLPALALMEQAKSVADTPGDGAKSSAPAGRAAAPPLRQLGDYEILREVGRGGMGVVYEAQQLSLGRHVAIKVLPTHALLDPRQLGRFHREAKAAARLHHTNIVPVFGVGEQDGQPYYVMQFIAGLGLDVVLDELRRLRHPRGKPAPTREDAPGGTTDGTCDASAAHVARSLVSGDFTTASGGHQPPDATHDRGGGAPRPPDTSAPVLLPGQSGGSTLSESGNQYWQSVARVGVQVADALAHAAGQGVLHRDIKPSNLLLDDTGNVWVTDFGLAKADDSYNLTQTGDIVGTLRYMAPERFSGQGDVRSDVYSLGLTLYEMLALRPAFDEVDRNKLFRQVMHDEPARPRKLNPGVPRDLETVVLKAIARDPAQRYQSPAEMADDLKRFVEDRPVRARRVGNAERFWRWCRRNPGIAVLGGALAAVLVLATAASLLAAGYFNRMRWSEAQAAQHERDAREVAEKAGDAERWERYRSNLAAASAALQLQKSDTARRALDAAPEQYRNWEWQYFHNQLDGATRVLPIPEWGRDFEEWPAIAVSPEGRQLATASTSHAVSLWDANSPAAQPAHVLRGHTRPISHLAFSPDGRQLATGSQDSIRLWDTATGRQLFELPTDASPTLAYSADGQRLLSNDIDGKYRLWDPTSGKLVAKVGDGSAHQKPRGVTFSPDGKRVAAAAGKEVRVYDAATGRHVATLGPLEWPVDDVSFSPDGKRISANRFDSPGPDTVYLWDADTGRLVARLTDHKARVSLAWSRDGTRLATATQHPENLIRLWDAADGKLLHTLPGHTNSPNDLSFSPDGTRLASAAMDQTARLWDVKTGAEVAVLRGHWAQIWTATFSPDSRRLVTSSEDHTMRLWDAANGELIAVLRGHSGSAYGYFTPDGSHLVSSSDDGTVRFWDLNLLERNGVLRGHTSFVYDVAFAPDGEQVASAAWDGTARLWDATTGRETAQLKHTKPYVTALSYSPDGRTLATANSSVGGTLWDLATHKPLLTVPTDPMPSNHGGVALGPDGKVLACTDYVRHLVLVYDTVARRQVAELHSDAPDAPDDHSGTGFVLLSPDGATLVTSANGGKVLLWDVATWKVRGSLPGFTAGAFRFAFSPDSRLLAVGARADNSLRLWDVPALQELASLHVGNPVYGLAFSPDGTRLAAGCRDNTIRLIDVATRKEVAELRGHTEYVHAVAWSPDGTRLVSGSGDATVRVWDSLSAQERMKRTEAKAPR
jgi:WD40 repeat protein/serine/threonine protein kinase